MAGTSTNRGEEFARVSRSESNNYESGRSDSKSPMHKGFMKETSRKIPGDSSKTGLAPTSGVHKAK